MVANRLIGHCLECSHSYALTAAEVAQIFAHLHRDTKLAVIGAVPPDFNMVYDWVWEMEGEEQEVES